MDTLSISFPYSPVKPCSKCLKLLSLESFTKDIYKVSGYTSACKECRRDKNRPKRIWRLKPEEILYPYTPIKFCPKCKTYKQMHEFGVDNHRPDGATTHCKLCKREVGRIADAKRRAKKPNNDIPKYEKGDHLPGRLQVRWSNKRAAKRGAFGKITREEWLTKCAECGNKCVRCGLFKALTIDHIIPLSKGGSNTIDNIQPLCKKCNSSKNNRL